MSEKNIPTNDFYNLSEELANNNALDVLRHAVFILEMRFGVQEGWCDCLDPAGVGAYICPDCGLYYHKDDCP